MPYTFLRFPEGKSKTVTFSYDDGCNEDRKLKEILDCYNMKCTFNINSNRLLNGGGLSVSDLLKFTEDGHEIAVHGAEHRANGISNPVLGIRDVLNCRETLETQLGKIIRGMAYPDSGITNFCNGTDYNDVKTYLKYLGIAYSRTLGGDNNSFKLPDDWYAWMPTAHHGNPDIFRYIDEFEKLETFNCYCADRYPRLFYIWGHSYEFTVNNNWNRIEEICKKLSGIDDIWYATNIEIYNYVNAYNSLVWSADGKRVYNPTLFTVFFIEGENSYSVAPGETLSIK